MSRIVPKLNLNKTPQQVDSNSLVFAKNIKLGKDGSIVRDDGIVVNFDLITSGLLTESELEKEWNLAGFISDNSGYYAFYNEKNKETLINSGNLPSIIIHHDEINNTNIRLTTGWKYSGGKIKGNVTTNLKGDTILTIAEYFDNPAEYKKIPLKSINLSLSTNEDNETIYTQTPKTPICNLRFLGKYINTIPNGTYQFFIRYEIYDDYYTNWIPCSKPMFTGNKKHLDKSVVGSLDYVNTSTDSNESFYFETEFIDIDDNIPYKKFQLGFILSHDDTTVARIWKKFDMSTNVIYFEYSTQDMIETDITDFTNVSFGLYNVKNITNFKNKQYIANYIETDFNPDLVETASKIEVSLCHDGEGGGAQPEEYTFLLYAGSTKFYEKINNNAINDYDNYTGQIYTILNSIITAYKNKSYSDGNSTTKILDTSDGISAIIKLYESQIIGDKPDGIEQFGDDNSAVYFFNDTCSSTSLDDGISLASFDPISELEDLYYINAVEKGTNKLFHYDGDSSIETKESSTYLLYFGRVVTIDGVDKWESYMISIEFTCYAVDTSSHTIDSNFKEYSTLVPFQEYNFYVHYVKANGEITNGYKIKNAITENSYNDANIITAIRSKQVLYPKFDYIDFEVPASLGYVACFFTIHHYKNKVFNLFNLKKTVSSDIQYDITSRAFGDAIELDTELYNVNNFSLITVKSNEIKFWNDAIHIGKYFSSVDTSNYKTFGDEGKVLLYDGETSTASEYVFDTGDLVFAKLDYEYDSEDVDLIKCTPYIKQTTYPSTKQEAYQMDLLGYICRIRKPINYLDTNTSTQRYISGGEVYKKDVYTDPAAPLDVDTIALTPLTDTNFGYYYKYKASTLNIIYSNFNLNYLALSDGIKPVISIKNNYLLVSVDSQLLSEVYDLPSMYKDILRKTYYKYNSLEKTIFDNTIRSSKLISDENKNYKLQFDSGDYYNVPTTKGKITNLAAIGDIILVHTNDSMFRFSGSNSLMTSGGENVQTAETDVFDTGIAEMFGSDKGYGGLQDNRNSIITQDGYFWYDNDSNTIYFYAGNNQMQILSDAISKLMNLDKIRNIDFCNDYYNDRLILNIMFNSFGFVTLSYNTRIKSFISLHDFNTGKCFSTKTKCYFTKNEKIYTYYKLKENETIDIANKTSYGELGATDNVYPSLSNFADGGQGNIPVIDILYRENYETIKTVNSINWICHAITKYTHNSDTEMAEEPKQSYAGERLRIYTDSCDTGYIDISAPRSNDEDFSHEDANHDGSALIPTNNTNYTNEYYTKPRYNLGKWYLNYFRNILNTNSKTDSDNKSLIYGKYIVARFVFDRTNNFKFENMSLNLSNNYNI